MKTIYLVRHGETHANIKRVWQDATDELSPKGLQQAEDVAQRLSTLKIDFALTSSMKRAVQTADVIGKKTGISFLESPFFVEVSVPTSTVGTTYEEVEGNAGFEYVATRDLHADDPDYRYEDEETLNELIERIKAGLAYLDSLPAQNILVVTHGTILRSLISLVMHQELLVTPYTIFTAGRRLETMNTSISVLHKKPDALWSVITFNDYAHFAE